MSRLVLAAVLALPLSAAAEGSPAEGRIETDQGQIEILGQPARVGERVDLPEGWFRVEEAGPEDADVGSFSVVAAESFDAGAAPDASGVAEAGDPGQAAAATRDCEAERAAYLAELWRQSGIEVASPAALIEGLRGGDAGPGTGFYWFALATDPFRPLAWSSALRDRADALARCVRGD